MIAIREKTQAMTIAMKVTQAAARARGSHAGGNRP